MEISFRVGDYWYVSEGYWTLDKEHAASWETLSTAVAAYRGLVDMAQRGMIAADTQRRLEITTVIIL